ncbi:hypothetical protein [Streptosporangium sp. NPDC051022]|uniref:hypothetical protein n=1 Tax=Streptosporangium sp. NPDC051022 TaxID=3155752 RepID=UPI00342F455B
MAERSARSGAALAAGLLAVTLLGACGNETPAALTPSAGNAPAAVAPAATAPAAEVPQATASPGETPAPCPTEGNAKRFAKTRFALHAGLALGAFHRYIYKPLRAGGFKEGAEKRKRTFAKAAVAGLFAVHELRRAKSFAMGNPTLCRGVETVSNSFSELVDKLKGGTATEQDLDASRNSFGNLQKDATSNGAPIQERNVTVPGAG